MLVDEDISWGSAVPGLAGTSQAPACSNGNAPTDIAALSKAKQKLTEASKWQHLVPGTVSQYDWQLLAGSMLSNSYR